MGNKPIKILAIDDIRDNLISLKALIEDSFPFATVITALSGERGIELALAENPDVMLLDIVMPMMDGFTVCRQLKEYETTQDIPVVFITALKGDRENRIKALEAGGDAFLAKPIDELELVAQIRAMVRIKEAREEKKNEKERLEKLVAERTVELQQELRERKKIEKELYLAKEKAEESDRLKSAFLANMSHEIRTPMNGILGFIDLLQSPNLSDKQYQMYLDIIKSSSGRLLNTINDIIEISRIEAEQSPIHYSRVELNEVMDYIFSFFRFEAEQKGLSFSVKKSFEGRKFHIITDKEKIISIFSNLIKNALKFTHAGHIEFGNHLNAEVLSFYVSDTGMGIPSDRINVIFDRFVQADMEITRPYEGSGLGLSIAKAYTEMLGGKINVESKPGKGTTISFTIKYMPAEKGPVHNGNHIFADNKESTWKILVAEDDDSNYFYLHALLSKQEHEVLRARNGEEVIGLLKKTPNVSVILMDMKMPVMDGYEATRHIREFDKRIPIIAQTAYALVGDREKALDAGCTDYVSKPVKGEELIQKIRQLTKAGCQ
ncbi:MAG: response regulator [Prolixibacteraceae bacterium]|jgi:signal transduction histidine kinase|nr:response regulator [Prolixibacteraceae bacterium]